MKFDVKDLTFFHKCSINWSNETSAHIRWEDLRHHSPWQACAGRGLWSFQGRWSAGWPSLAFVSSARWRRSPSDASERTWWLWAGSPRLWIAFLWCQPGNKHTNKQKNKKLTSAASLSRNDNVMCYSCIRDRILQQPASGVLLDGVITDHFYVRTCRCVYSTIPSSSSSNETMLFLHFPAEIRFRNACMACRSPPILLAARCISV